MTDIMELRRKGFESAWERVTGGKPVRYKQGQYVNDACLISWIAYNAALDSVCVELSSQSLLMRSEVIEAIKRAGLKVK